VLAAIGPVWDGNEVCLLAGAVCLCWPPLLFLLLGSLAARLVIVRLPHASL
jgi:cytochrome bd-type quinol oxidase subunit 2